jgi:leucyl/phenylalanyl-tRNA---protein transferase
MPVTKLDHRLIFPSVTNAEPNGLLAIGGDLSVERLLLAYQNGIFPWYSDNEPILWWSPNPRFVLFPSDLKVSTTMKQLLKKRTFTITFNTAFKEVMENCQKVNRKEQEGAWINEELIKAYCQLYTLGKAVSVEVWQDNHLVGGLYGVLLGKIFFGESMFSLVSNASKAGFITFIHHYQALGLQIIDCQVYTTHLESLGATMIPREDFLKLIQLYIQRDNHFQNSFKS